MLNIFLGPAGTYADLFGQANCTACPTGTFSNSTGGNSIDVCLNCTVGYYNPTAGTFIDVVA